jgi:hypothetical protein
MTYVPFVIPRNYGIVVLIVIIIRCNVWLGPILFHVVILIIWHGWMCLKHKDNPNCCKDQTFFYKCITSIIKR